MKRRLFIFGSVAALAAAAGGGAFLVMSGNQGNSAPIPTQPPQALQEALKSMFNPAFQEAAKGKNADTLLAKLKEQQIVDAQGMLHSDMVLKLAKTDPIVVYNNRYYSQTELDLYSLAYLNASN